MIYSAPTTASHPMTEEDQDERASKRRKMAQQPKKQPDDTPMEDEDTPPPIEPTVSGRTSVTSQASSQDMDMETTTGTSSSAASTNHQYHRPADFNNFNGNAISDEELVYQVLESGAQSYAEVVEFCIARGISVSRILHMDLMRRLSYLRAG